MKLEYDVFFTLPIVIQMEAKCQGVAKACSVLCLIKILSYCEDGRCFKSCKNMTHILEVGDNIGKFVWDFCIEREILRETPNGYTSKDYVIPKKSRFEF